MTPFEHFVNHGQRANIKAMWRSLHYLFSLGVGYLEKPENVDMDYTLSIAMTINKYLSTNFIFQTIYDDNAFKGFQTRQVFGLGVNYNF